MSYSYSEKINNLKNYNTLETILYNYFSLNSILHDIGLPLGW